MKGFSNGFLSQHFFLFILHIKFIEKDKLHLENYKMMEVHNTYDSTYCTFNVKIISLWNVFENVLYVVVLFLVNKNSSISRVIFPYF